VTRRPIYIRYRGFLIGLSAVIIGMLSMGMAFWTGHKLAVILFLLSFPLLVVGGVIHFIDMFRRLRNGPDDVFR
jgi:hypothetical protein